MKQPWKTIGAWVPLLLVLSVLVYAVFIGRSYEVDESSRESLSTTGPPRIVQNGPYVRDLVMSWNESGADVTLRASRLCFVKTKLMGMDNALMKKMRLDDVVVEVMRGGEQVLRMRQDRIEAAPSGKRFVLVSPTILFPKGTRQPDRAVIHKDRREIVFWYGEESRPLELSAGSLNLPPGKAIKG